MDPETLNQIRHFCSHFAGHEESFVLIGGSACSCWYADSPTSFRGTRDIDVVIVVEALNREFVDLLVAYLRDNGYASWVRHPQNGPAKRVMYRFVNPANRRAAAKIELLSRSGEIRRIESLQSAVPIKAEDEYTGLSGIVLDDAYYDFIRTQCQTVMGCPVLSLPGLVLLKIKAFLNLGAAVAEAGAPQGGDSAADNRKKHRNDVFFMLATMEPALYATPISLPPALMDDVRAFAAQFMNDPSAESAVRDSLRRRLGRAFPFSMEMLISTLNAIFSPAE